MEDFKVKMSTLAPEDPKLKMMQKVMTELEPVLLKSDINLDELLRLASMCMETWLDKRFLSCPGIFLILKKLIYNIRPVLSRYL